MTYLMGYLTVYLMGYLMGPKGVQDMDRSGSRLEEVLEAVDLAYKGIWCFLPARLVSKYDPKMGPGKGPKRGTFKGRKLPHLITHLITY